MDQNRVRIALEPEAASIWCRNVDPSVNETLSESGKRYMVADLGGKT